MGILKLFGTAALCAASAYAGYTHGTKQGREEAATTTETVTLEQLVMERTGTHHVLKRDGRTYYIDFKTPTLIDVTEEYNHAHQQNRIKEVKSIFH